MSRGGVYSFHADVQPLDVVTDELAADLGVELGHGVPGLEPYFPKPHGRDLKSFAELPGTSAKSRSQGRGTWSTDARAAGARPRR